MSNDTTASTSTIKTWQERTGNHNVRSGSVKHMIAEIADLRAALARAPLPAEGNKPVLWYKPLTGVECKADGRCYDISFSAIDGYTPLFAAPAQADEARDAARYRWLRTQPFDTWKRIAWNTWNDEPAVFPIRDEDIDASIAASLAGKDKP